MRITTALLLLATLSLGACVENKNTQPHAFAANQTGIIGGYPVRTEDPVAASTVSLMVFYNNSLFSICTGTVVSNDIIMTASHCLQEVTAQDFVVHIGTRLPTQLNQTSLLKVEKFKTHPQFEMILDKDGTPVTGKNDIALIKLADKIPDSAKPVAILKNHNTLLPGQPLLLAGFGLLQEVGQPQYAQELNAVTVPLEREWDHILVTDQTKAQGACSGDSGGPAFLADQANLIVVGITRGPHAQVSDCRHYGEYTNASKFEDFIIETVKELNGTLPVFVDPPKKF